MKIEIIKTPEGFTFDKSHFSSRQKIANLYKTKLKYPISNQGFDLSERDREAYVAGDEFGSYMRLQRAMKHDTRLPQIVFRDTETAKMALDIARKLEAMNKEEFLKSGYPYKFLDEIGLSGVVVSG